MTTPAVLETSDSGRILRILHENGRIIAEILIHGHLRSVIDNCTSDAPIVRGRASIFRGELFQLAGYEFLNISDEKIEEKI